MQNLSPTTHAPQVIPTQTPAEPQSRVETLISNAARRASDEAVSQLSWGDRDQIARSLTEALRLLREAREATAAAAAPDEGEAVIICRECGGEEFEADAIRGECQTCAYYYALANSSSSY